ncbi:DNA polymerase IV [Natrinema sp. CBA1119]|nr:DNA polymerase IV [Natrinema sp. CBA1119]PGF17562.1 DNA polymerase IV [Natrinema sp. CBA1119]
MSDGPRLPGVDGEDDEDRIVCHVDADCFYASCERLREPDLRGEPLVVGMGYEEGDTIGAVATASYEAREFGVESAQAISTALERLPRRAAYEAGETDDDVEREETGYYRSVDMDYYESVASEVREILHECADTVREVSIDEAYLNVTERTAWEVADGFARHVRDRIRREVGVTVSVGVAPTMSTAKIASDFDKPDGLTVVEPGEIREFLAPLEVDLLHGVGPVTARELREMGLETAGDVAATDPEPLVDRFGERGRELYDRARGEDDRRVEPKGDPKSFSRESAFAEPVDAPAPKYELIDTLAAAVADRAQREGALYRTIGVKAVTPPYDVNTRERSLSGPVDDPELVDRIARDLFTEFESDPVRKLGVRVANLEFVAADQASLESWERSGDGFETDAGDGLSDGEPESDPEPAGDDPSAGQSSLADFS